MQLNTKHVSTAGTNGNITGLRLGSSYGQNIFRSNTDQINSAIRRNRRRLKARTRGRSSIQLNHMKSELVNEHA